MLDANAEIPLRLTAAECNEILAILSDAPWRRVAGIIAKVQQQIVAVEPSAFGDVKPAATANGVDHVPDR